MPKTLYLIRHAKAIQAEGGQKDIERKLSAEGLRDANHLGIYLSKEKILPELIISSNAERALQTAGIISEQIKYGSDKVKIEPGLFEASVRILLKVVNELPEKFETVIVVAHNPALSFLIDYLSGEPIGNISPCTAIGLQFDCDDWRLVDAGTGYVIMHKRPD